MRSMNVSDVMWNHIEPVRGEWLISRVVSHLSENHVTGLPVVDSQRKLIGFVSEQDCIHALLVSNYHCEGEPAVREVMILQPVTVSPDLGVVDLAQKLGAGKPKVYPVVDNGKLVGIVTRSAILDHLVKSGCKVGTPKFANSDE